MKVHRLITEPIRPSLTWDEKWKGVDRGLIACWERGRVKGFEAPMLVQQVRNGQLVILPWKGGFEKSINKKQKYGSFYYLAMWQGLRGDDLDIDTEGEPALTCSVTDMTAIFTDDIAKLLKP
ncbi:MAG: hypothetical protein KJ795_05440 [Gammaproteobacteria bacterium]|nr:hypothetical protein [Gammaproteobacteria bacterium]MBU1776155.1 hypothetical protein [Gammaproteobacteria bacterium]MBU1967915.1 hypothetical protein [Gammaproteobacteria bacterium]